MSESIDLFAFPGAIPEYSMIPIAFEINAQVHRHVFLTQGVQTNLFDNLSLKKIGQNDHNNKGRQHIENLKFFDFQNIDAKSN